MATLSDTIRKTKGLEQIAQQVKNVAMFYAPKKDGTLIRKINSYNKAKIGGMIKIVGSGTKSQIKIDIDVSPPGAEYGKWFNDPPKVKTKNKHRKKSGRPALKRTAISKGNWQFGKKAIKDKSVKNQISKFTKEFAKEFKRYAILQLKEFRFT